MYFIWIKVSYLCINGESLVPEGGSTICLLTLSCLENIFIIINVRDLVKGDLVCFTFNPNES